MGTDINCFVEKLVFGEWRLAEPLVRNRYWDEEFPDEPQMVPRKLFNNRASVLFAILAGVRNPPRSPYKPFAVIANPRGIPPDASPGIRALYESDWSRSADLIDQYGFNPSAHHASWLIVRELLEFDWDRVCLKIGKFAETYKDAASPGLVDDILRKLAIYGPPDKVRIVFWFDS
jgi:hypothetical protein